MGRPVVQQQQEQQGCCSEKKKKLRKGLWSPEEDERLATHIARFGVSCWSSVPDLAGLQRCGKSCRLRWMNYLRPDLKRGRFSQQEEDIILSLHDKLGNSWSQIAARLPGRSDNEIKNFWNARLRKKLRQKKESSTAAAAAGHLRRVEVDRRPPAAAFNAFPHRSAHDDRPSPAPPAPHIIASASAAVATEAPAPTTTTDDAVPVDAAAAAAAWGHGGGGGHDDGFLEVMVDDEASLLLGEYLDGGHDGFSFWGGGHVFS
ncbi:hypothetical protein GUJ93_ZPchr0008g12822 [Zizania palustris]|uniref:Uncharacterized protein n=1 Tax=Zizania palustris TaxID=103762 RepID=A0A8J5RUS4_ZIZPA|nr:hypothetical protein GUJ93_ZPchr0008g12822 [Zizania palustris]